MKSGKGESVRDLFSVERCKKILNRHGNGFTDDEIKKIRDWLIKIAEIEYLDFLKKSRDEQKCNSIHSGFYG
jgi:hypothetical protein